MKIAIEKRWALQPQRTFSVLLKKYFDVNVKFLHFFYKSILQKILNYQSVEL